jgi:addiction module HigA family antidote
VEVVAIHPGEHLSEELRTLGMSAAELARNLAVPTNRVTQILNGQRAVTGDTALRLSHFFGTSAEFWLNLQNLYELRIADQKAGAAIQILPTLKPSRPVPQAKNARQKSARAVSAKNLHGSVGIGRPQGKEFSRGARRTR